MRYIIQAKIVGEFMPAKSLKIGECCISKTFDFLHQPDDMPTIPVRMKDSEFHVLERGVRNFVHYPQRSIRVRAIESEYGIETTVDAASLYGAIEEANERFADVTGVLSLSVRSTVKAVGNRRIKRRGYGKYYDFEIVAAYLTAKGNRVRVKLPEPPLASSNFFPESPSKAFVARARKYLACQSGAFPKSMVYFRQASKERYSGNANAIETLLSFVKCIELIAKAIPVEQVIGAKSKKPRKLYTGKRIELIGKKLKVTKKYIGWAKQAWKDRSEQDLAHANSNHQPRWLSINYDQLDAAASEYLIRYWQYLTKGDSARK